MPPQSDGTRGFWFRGVVWGFIAVCSGAVAFVLRVVAHVLAGERPATHAAAWSGSTRGFNGFVGGAVAVCSEGLLREHVLAGGPASHACRRGSGSTRGFNFFVLGGSFTRSGVDGTRGLGVGGLIRCAGRPREWSCGAVPPQERWHEGGWFLFFLWRLLRCRRGILSHVLGSGQPRMPPQERQHEGFLVWGILSHAREWMAREG